MRLDRLAFGLLLCASGSVVRAQAPAPPNKPAAPSGAAASAPLAANASIDQVLDALDERGKNLRDFTARVAITKGNPDLGNLDTDFGQVWFSRAGAAGPHIRVTFDKHKQGKIISTNQKQDYLLEGEWLIDRDYHKQTQVRRQVLKPGEKVNLLKLGEGPFPLPIGQSKEDVHKQFEVKELPPNKADKTEPPDTIHLRLIPRPSTRFAKHFGQINVWVNRASHFPVKISTESPDGSEVNITTLSDLAVNPPGGLKEEVFKLPPIDQKEWSLRTEPYGE